MNAPVTQWRAEHGLTILYLGSIAVGRTAPSGGRGGKPRWLFNLNGVTAIWHNAKTEQEARQEVETALAQWLRRAGLA